MVSSKNKQIFINQTLHGYLDGHRLLSSSIELSKDAKKKLLILSDLSGPVAVTGYMKYITGYPIYDEKSFALAKTWYAAEMLRAGCVWTHTLLINFNDLKQISDLSELIKLFSKPEGSSDTKYYEKPIVWNENSNSSKIGSYVKKDKRYDRVKCILKFLYDKKSSSPVIVVADNSSEYEDIVMRIWSQQWPNLRKSFKFCTGAITNRKCNNEMFDLQVVPSKNVRQFERDVIDARIVDKKSINQSFLEYPDWIEEAIEGLFESKSLRFGAFLEYAGTDIPGERASYADLAHIYVNIFKEQNKEVDLEKVFKYIHNNYPKATEGKYLKNLIIGESTEEIRLDKNLSDIYVLESLSISKYSKMFDLKTLNIRNRTIRAWKNDKHNTIELLLRLIRTEVNSIGEEIIKCIAEIIGEERLLEIDVGHPELLYTFVMHNPALAIQPKLWISSRINQMELLEHLSNVPNIHQNLKEKITKSIISSENQKLIVKLYQKWGDFIINQALHQIDTSDSLNSDSLHSELLNIFKDCPTVCLEWLSNQNYYQLDTAVIIASQLNPNGEIEKNFRTRIWLEVLDLIDDNTPYKLKVMLSNFLLPFGLNNPGKDAYKLVVFSFPIIHRELANSRLEYGSWEILDQMLPELPWYRSWDKCERLRLGVIEKFNTYDWPDEEFRKVYKKDNLY